MQELASQAVGAVEVLVVLLAQLSLIVLRHMLLFLQLPYAMSEGALTQVELSYKFSNENDGSNVFNILTLSLNSQYPNTSQLRHISVLYLTTKPDI